eukprot:13794322-Alexandrium_andersonii.AAC.1
MLQERLEIPAAELLLARTNSASFARASELARGVSTWRQQGPRLPVDLCALSGLPAEALPEGSHSKRAQSLAAAAAFSATATAAVARVASCKLQ